MDAFIYRARLESGFLSVHGICFGSTALALLSDHVPKRARVDVAIVPGDLTRCWVFDPIYYRWLDAAALRPDLLVGLTLGEHLNRRGVPEGRKAARTRAA
jgi:hypothetical protein